MKPLHQRLLCVPDRSFFLFGPRGVGKSTWLMEALPGALRLDLLDARTSLELGRSPTALEGMAGTLPPGSWIVLDEIQRIPALLDEVHRLMQMRRWRFALCGSSARKLKRGGANLLAGRAVTRRMAPFVSAELGSGFDLRSSLEWGNLPAVREDAAGAADLLTAYVHTYLREEIREEGVLRRLDPFLRFLAIAGMMNGQTINLQNIAREAAVPRSTVESYFSVLTDTLLGEFLTAWRPHFKVREQVHPKFYWFDAGVARGAAGLLRQPAEREWLGRALEAHLLHEIRVHNEVSDKHCPIRFYRTSAGVEIDFILETVQRTSAHPAQVVGIEVKLAERWDRGWERPLRDLASQKGVRVQRMIGVYTGPRSYRFDGFDVLPATEFLRRLHAGDIF
ncbi:MAG: ATP-binding protein [Planctomycetes bacterium]|nr:ATP-binding protein [Planctomycetota bacterium]